MKQYNYCRNTKAFTRATEARLDELESRIQKRDVFLHPRHCTFKAPPKVGSGIVCYFDENLDEWLTALDYRGVPLYSTDNGQVTTTTHIGRVPDGMTELPPPDNESRWNGVEWVPDTEKIAARDLAHKLSNLRSHDIALFRMIWEIFNVGRNKGLWSAGDFPADLAAEVQEIKQKLDEIR